MNQSEVFSDDFCKGINVINADALVGIVPKGAQGQVFGSIFAIIFQAEMFAGVQQ